MVIYLTSPGTSIVLLLMMAALGAGCQPSMDVPSGEVGLDENADGTTIVLTHGQPLVITLASNPTTGYSWAIAELDSSILHCTGDAEFSPSKPQEPQRVGAGGTETFRFTASRPGTTTLKMVYQRPWEKDSEPPKQFRLTITIR